MKQGLPGDARGGVPPCGGCGLPGCMLRLRLLALRPMWLLTPLPPEGARCIPNGLPGGPPPKGPPIPFPPEGALDIPAPLLGDPAIFPLPALAIPTPGLFPGVERGPCSCEILLAGAKGDKNPDEAAWDAWPGGIVRSWLPDPWRLASEPWPVGLWALCGACWTGPRPAKGEFPARGCVRWGGCCARLLVGVAWVPDEACRVGAAAGD